MRTLAFVACLASASVVAIVVPASARSTKPAAYVGTWATSLAECKIPLTDKNGPAVLTEKDYTQAQTHCTFGPLVYRRYAWHTKVACDTAGAKQDDTLEISVSHDALMMVWGKSQATVDYARCVNPAAN